VISRKIEYWNSVCELDMARVCGEGINVPRQHQTSKFTTIKQFLSLFYNDIYWEV
jgi:hypothetical protein